MSGRLLGNRDGRQSDPLPFARFDRLLLVAQSVVVDPAALVPGCIGVVCPVDYSAFFSPDIFTMYAHPVAFVERHSWCHFGVMSDQNGSAVGKTDQESLMWQAFRIVSEQLVHLRIDSDFDAFQPLLLRFKNLGLSGICSCVY